VVEAAGDEVRELHLAIGPHALDRRADRAADDRRLGQRRVHHARGAELVDEAVGHLEGAAEDADVLAHHEDALVGAHLLAHRVGDRLQVGHGRHQAGPPREAAPRRLAVGHQRGLVGEQRVRRRVAVGHRHRERLLDAASISALTSARSASTSTPSSSTRRTCGRSGPSRATPRLLGWARTSCRRGRRGRACASVTASMSVGPSPAIARLARLAGDLEHRLASLPSTQTPGKP
jgi:hypothetical protein